jgi:hypothetical protein
MYAGHFALALIFQFYYPGVNSFLLTFGVALLDIIFAFLAYFNLEGVSINPKAGFLGVDLHCPYSHSLVSSLIISLLWGCLGINSHTFLPLFLSSFSHFILDWLVHNRDIEFYPHSHIFIGGTECWSRYPYATYYFELLLCIICSSETLRKTADILNFNTHGLLLIVAIGYVFYLHYQRRPSTSGQLAAVLKKIPEEKQGQFIFTTFMNSFIKPAISLGLLLHLFTNQ